MKKSTSQAHYSNNQLWCTSIKEIVLICDDNDAQYSIISTLTRYRLTQNQYQYCKNGNKFNSHQKGNEITNQLTSNS